MAKLKKYIRTAEKLANTPDDKKRVAMWRTVYDYMVKGRKNYVVNSAKLKATPAYKKLAPNFIKDIDVTVCWQEGINPYTLVTGHHMIEEIPGVLGSRNAKLDIKNDANRHWAALGADNAWVEFDLGKLYKLDEMRIWNYQQNRGFKLVNRGMRNVEITASPTLDISDWRVVYKGIIPKGDDKNSFAVSKIINFKKRLVRYIRITVKGGISVGNWGDNPKARNQNWAGLGQVRFYGKESK